MLSVKRGQGTLSPRLTLPQPGARDGLFGTPEAQLSADHAGRHQVPLVVADGTPFSILEHLHAALPDVGTTSQPHQWLLKRHTVLLSTAYSPLFTMPPGSPLQTQAPDWELTALHLCERLWRDGKRACSLFSSAACSLCNLCPGPLGSPSGTLINSSSHSILVLGPNH